jgi:anti-sigma regulatory factor (Ser/Thr protein kinase)
MDPSDSYSNRVACTLSGSDAVARAIEAARRFGEAQLLPENELARLCIVIEELVANLYDHGGLTGADKVELVLINEPGHIRVTLADPGAVFDLRSAPKERQPPDRGGGVGLDIVRAWAQIVGYEVTSDGNRLEFLLPLR